MPDHKSIAAELLMRLNKGILGAYELRPGLIREQYGIEQTVLAGGMDTDKFWS